VSQTERKRRKLGFISYDSIRGVISKRGGKYWEKEKKGGDLGRGAQCLSDDRCAGQLCGTTRNNKPSPTTREEAPALRTRSTHTNDTSQDCPAHCSTDILRHLCGLLWEASSVQVSGSTIEFGPRLQLTSAAEVPRLPFYTAPFGYTLQIYSDGST
jgi:hypothetical protein